MEKAYFNSSVPREDYDLIKIQAIKLGKPVRTLISELVMNEADKIRKEASSEQVVRPRGKVSRT